MAEEVEMDAWDKMGWDGKGGVLYLHFSLLLFLSLFFNFQPEEVPTPTDRSLDHHGNFGERFGQEWVFIIISMMTKLDEWMNG